MLGPYRRRDALPSIPIACSLSWPGFLYNCAALPEGISSSPMRRMRLRLYSPSL